MSPSISESLSSKVDDPEFVSVTVPASFTTRVSLTVNGRSLTAFKLIRKLSFVLQKSPIFVSPNL